MSRIRFVAFDLDGTLTRGDTVIECLATAMGFIERARELEALHEARRDRESLRVLREEIATSLRGFTEADLCGHLARLFYVGATPPPDMDVVHLPDGDLLAQARLVVGDAAGTRS